MMWQLSENKNKLAVIDESGGQYTYDELFEAGKKLIGHVKNGRCLVFILCTNEVGSLLGYITFLNHRIVPVLVDANLSRDLLNSLILTYKPDYLWLPEAIIGDFVAFDSIYTTHSFALVKTPFNKEFRLHDDLALLLTTSGSTGSPKLVRQSYANIKANTESIIEYLQIDASERPITTLPMSYTYGLSIINTHLYAGASIILTQKTLMQKEFWQQFKDFSATSFGGVPYVYEMLDKLRFYRMPLPSLRTMTQAGGKLSPELHKKFAGYAKDNGKKFVVMYGQTEATARMSYLPHEKSLEKYGSMGIAIPGGKFTLIDDYGEKIVETEKVGELVYEGPNVTLGYAETGADLEKGDERRGRLITGDMAKRDADGYYYIVGRKKRFLKIFGSRINLDETERLVKSFYTEHECVCAGVDDKMYVFITDASIQESVKAFLSEKTGFNSSAFKIMVINAIPRNDAGKIQYKDLAEYYNA